MYNPVKMFSASSNFNPYSAQSPGGHGNLSGGHGHAHGGHGHGGHGHGGHGGHDHGGHGHGGHGHGGHDHGGHDHGGHGHSHGAGGQCGGDSEKPDVSFPAPGPTDKPKVAAPPPPSKPDLATMNIVEAVQYGEMDKLKEFVDNGEDIRKADTENVTLLHWAAINNRTEIVRYLISNGAIVDQKGGNLEATPLNWAVRQGLLNMVVLLMQYGADPHSKDIEGCTCLHVACQLSQTAVAAYLIAKGMDVDLLDGNGMTPLMWVAYRSFGVDAMRLLLTMGASLNRRDKFHKNTALHWAVISSNHNALTALCKASADCTITNEKGESPLDLAKQKKSGWMMTQLEFLKLNEGREQPGWLRNISTNKTFRYRIMFFLPFYTLFATAAVLEWSSGWSCVMLMISTLLITFGLVRLFYSYDLNSNPIALGIAISTKALVYSVAYFYILEYCSFYFTLSFVVFSTILFYSFYKTWKTDPGVLVATHGERKRIIVDLAEKGNLDFKSFCPTCLIRRPIRSKHCSTCDRCVARMDHHCPWVDNCIGVDNHVLFFIYLFSVIVCFFYVLYGSFLFYSIKCQAFDNGVTKGITAMFNCSGMVTWTVMLGIFYLFWVIALFGSQCHQVFFRGMTTNEVMNAPRYQHFFSSSKDGMPQSPFSRGILGNLADFFQCSFCGLVKYVRIDWKTEFSYEKYRQRGKQTI